MKSILCLFRNYVVINGHRFYAGDKYTWGNNSENICEFTKIDTDYSYGIQRNYDISFKHRIDITYSKTVKPYYK